MKWSAIKLNNIYCQKYFGKHSQQIVWNKMNLFFSFKFLISVLFASQKHLQWILGEFNGIEGEENVFGAFWRNS